MPFIYLLSTDEQDAELAQAELRALAGCHASGRVGIGPVACDISRSAYVRTCAEIIAHEGGTAYVLAEDYERELAAATRERDEARALNAQWAEKAAAWFASPEAAQRLQGYRELAQQVATAQNERDEARAEVAKLRAELRRALFYSDVHLNNGWCPCRDAPEERDEECPACQRIDELAATEAP